MIQAHVSLYEHCFTTPAATCLCGGCALTRIGDSVQTTTKAREAGEEAEGGEEEETGEETGEVEEATEGGGGEGVGGGGGGGGAGGKTGAVEGTVKEPMMKKMRMEI